MSGKTVDLWTIFGGMPVYCPNVAKYMLLFIKNKLVLDMNAKNIGDMSKLQAA